jgi:hypothetical protein
MSILELYLRLKNRQIEHNFEVTPIDVFPGTYLGINSDGWPAFFSDPSPNMSRGPLMRTSHVTLGLGIDYVISILGQSPLTVRLDSLVCESNEDLDRHVFLSLLEGFLGFLQERKIKRSELVDFFLSVSRLFSITPANDFREERQGLWGELFFMSRVKGFKFWLPYWHSDPSRTFDFTNNNKRIEVKTSVRSERIHHFSHRQLYSFGEEEIVIASIMLRKEEAGVSLKTLIDLARGEVSNESQLIKLARAVRMSRMEDSNEEGPLFDETEAEKSLAFFWAKDSPHFGMPEPAGVTQTHYRVDLSTAPTIELADIEVWLTN